MTMEANKANAQRFVDEVVNGATSRSSTTSWHPISSTTGGSPAFRPPAMARRPSWRCCIRRFPTCTPRSRT